MSTPQWDNVQPLIASQKQENRMMAVSFSCPVTGETVDGRASMNKERSLSNTVKESFLRQLVWSLVRTVRRMLGFGIAGSVAADATRHAASDASEKARFTDEDRQKAIVEAFRNVQSLFKWDEAGGRWVHTSADTSTGNPEAETDSAEAPEA